jgi:hypothetical protein
MGVAVTHHHLHHHLHRTCLTLGSSVKPRLSHVVSFKVLACARIVCNIVCVQVQGRIHRELCCKN